MSWCSFSTFVLTEPLKEEMPTMPAQTLAVEPSPMMEGMVAPQFLEPLPTLQAIDGQEIKMSCRVAGVPMPRISFFHDSKNIDEDEEFVITYDKETGEVKTSILVSLKIHKGGEFFHLFYSICLKSSV